MVQTELMALSMTTGVFVGMFALLALVFRAQIRRYNRTVATDLLDDWTARLELMDPADRLRLAPPSEIVAAMVALPAPGLLTSWTERPARSR